MKRPSRLCRASRIICKASLLPFLLLGVIFAQSKARHRLDGSVQNRILRGVPALARSKRHAPNVPTFHLLERDCNADRMKRPA